MNLGLGVVFIVAYKFKLASLICYCIVTFYFQKLSAKLFLIVSGKNALCEDKKKSSELCRMSRTYEVLSAPPTHDTQFLLEYRDGDFHRPSQDLEAMAEGGVDQAWGAGARGAPSGPVLGGSIKGNHTFLERA